MENIVDVGCGSFFDISYELANNKEFLDLINLLLEKNNSSSFLIREIQDKSFDRYTTGELAMLKTGVLFILEEIKKKIIEKKIKI